MPITEHQRQLRKNHLGASDIAALFGAHPFKTPWDVWASKVFEPREVEGQAIDFGNRFEEAVLDWAADALGVRVRRNQFRVCHQDNLFAANFDALVVGDPLAEAIEAKTSGILRGYTRDQWGEDGTDVVPERVWWQAQAQAFVGDLRMVHVAALLGGRGFQLFHIPRSGEASEMIQDQGRQWWDKYVVGETAPDSAPSPDTVKRLPVREGKTVTVPDALAMAYLEAKAKAKAAEQELTVLRTDLEAMIQDAEAAEFSGGLFTYKEQTRRDIDHKRLRAEYPEVAEACQITRTFRVLRDKTRRAQVDF